MVTIAIRCLHDLDMILNVRAIATFVREIRLLSRLILLKGDVDIGQSYLVSIN